MTDQDFRALNAELGFPPEAADRLLHDRRADERRTGLKIDVPVDNSAFAAFYKTWRRFHGLSEFGDKRT